MQTQQQRSTYEQLELIATLSVQFHQNQTFLASIRNTILLILTAGNKPRISQSIDATDKLYWRIYDPRIKWSIICESEQKVYCWLEQQICRQQVQSPNLFATRFFLARFH